MFIMVNEHWYLGALVGRYSVSACFHDATMAERQAMYEEQDKLVDTLKALKVCRYPNPGWTVGNGIHANLVTDEMLKSALVSARDWIGAISR